LWQTLGGPFLSHYKEDPKEVPNFPFFSPKEINNYAKNAVKKRIDQRWVETVSEAEVDYYNSIKRSQSTIGKQGGQLQFKGINNLFVNYSYTANLNLRQRNMLQFMYGSIEGYDSYRHPFGDLKSNQTSLFECILRRETKDYVEAARKAGKADYYILFQQDSENLIIPFRSKLNDKKPILQNNCKLTSLPDDILNSIIQRLPISAIGALSQTCRKMEIILRNDKIWEMISRDRMSIDNHFQISYKKADPYNKLNGVIFDSWKSFFQIRYSTTMIRWLFTISQKEESDFEDVIFEVRLPGLRRKAIRIKYPLWLEEDREVARRYPNGWID